MARTLLGIVFSLIGAIVGSVVGVALFYWCLRQGLYAMVLPGAALGLGVHLASLERSPIRGGVSAVAALILGVVTEWKYFPFVKDESFPYLLKNLTSVLPVHLLMIAVGGVFGYWWGKEASPWAPRMGKPVQVQR